jgi:chromatin assembly factor 1 subunit A
MKKKEKKDKISEINKQRVEERARKELNKKVKEKDAVEEEKEWREKKKKDALDRVKENIKIQNQKKKELLERKKQREMQKMNEFKQQNQLFNDDELKVACKFEIKINDEVD